MAKSEPDTTKTPQGTPDPINPETQAPGGLFPEDPGVKSDSNGDIGIGSYGNPTKPFVLK